MSPTIGLAFNIEHKWNKVAQNATQNAKILRGPPKPQTLDYQTDNPAFVVKKGKNTEGGKNNLTIDKYPFSFL
jgi:hypothetical protein